MCDHLNLYRDLDDECPTCGGTGSLAFFDADCGYSYETCHACAGVASGGVFVVRLHVGKIQFEQTWHARGFEVACARADRWAELVRHFCRRHAVPGAEVRVRFKPDDPELEEVEVHAVAVWTHQPTRAA